MTHRTSPVGACHMASHARRLERRLSGHVASGQCHMGRRLQGCTPHRGIAHATSGTSPSRLQGCTPHRGIARVTSGTSPTARPLSTCAWHAACAAAGTATCRGARHVVGVACRHVRQGRSCRQCPYRVPSPIQEWHAEPAARRGNERGRSPAVGGRLDTATGPAAHVGLPTPASERTAPPWRGARGSSPALSVGSSGRLVGLASRPATRSIRPVPGVTLPRGGDDPPVQHRRAPASRGRAPLRLRATA